jgi:hypothetical protein
LPNAAMKCLSGGDTGTNIVKGKWTIPLPIQFFTSKPGACKYHNLLASSVNPTEKSIFGILTSRAMNI